MEKDFMITQLVNKLSQLTIYNFRFSIRIAIVFFLLGLHACKPDLYDAPIPEGIFPDIKINLSLPEYTPLNNDGGTMYIDGGVRGIVIHRKTSLSYIAYERNCSFHPNDACATIELHSSKLFLIDTCCGSSFDLNEGTPTGGPAWRPLRKYRTFVDGSQLTITSESLNGM